MNRLEGATKYINWLTTVFVAALAAGCSGSGEEASSPSGSGLPAPSVTLVAPLPNAKNVPINVKVFTATFTHEMDPATLTEATFTLQCGGDPVSGTLWVNYLAQQKTASLTLGSPTNLPENTSCTATVNTGAKDMAGTSLADNFSWVFTTARVADTTAPTVIQTINPNGAAGVAINTKVGATFSKAMDPATITPTTFSVMQGTVPVSGTVSYKGVSALFTPASNLLPSTLYTITVKGGINGAKDLAGNPMIGDFVISWTTGSDLDTTPPKVTRSLNATGASDVALNTNVGAIFSEDMDPQTITTTTFIVSTGTSTVPGTLIYSGVSAIFNPLSSLAPNTRYTNTIKGGSSGVKDLAGNSMSSDYVWSWTTGSTTKSTAPTVIGTVHANGATDVAIDSAAGVTFSESMNPLTITTDTFTLRETISGVAVDGGVKISGENVVFGITDFGPRPSSFLSPNTNYTATIKGGDGGVEDLAGNTMSMDYVWNWTTGALRDTTPPTVALFSPADLTQSVAINSAIKITFSEAMDPLTINTTNFFLEGVAGTVTYDAINRVASFTPSSNLASNTTYTAIVTTGIRDLAGLSLGMGADIVWRFTTAGI